MKPLNLKSRSFKTSISLLSLAALGVGVPVSGCQTEPEPLDLTSLRRSGEVSFVCIDPEGNGAPLIDCPQGERTDDLGFTVGKPGYELHALVTQTLTGEVAVVRTTGVEASTTGTRTSGQVLDVDRSVPGVTPLRVGAQPVDVVSTPGGQASFVGVGEVGREGVFALPTPCIFEPTDEARRDLTTWPACSLSSRPGQMEVLVDSNDSGREFCGSAPDSSILRSSEDASCRVNLDEEELTPGRRKLLVSLPDEGKFVVLDAQELLDRKGGAFEPCHIESEFELSGDVPSEIVQPLPADLHVEGELPARIYDQLGGAYEPEPSGLAVSDGRLYVADQAGPLIHRLDVQDPCELAALPPLIATSYLQPDRIVTTSQVAVSPLSPSGSRYAYAVDEVGNELASIMIFDVSPGASARTPVVRPDSAYLPLEAPDRIEFGAPVKDVAFATLERPVADVTTGSAVAGTACNPDPNISSTSVEAAYRPSSEDGAHPFVMRGLFGYALLSSGQMVLIDVEDYDAECRRPASQNRADEVDFRGCRGDSYQADYLTLSGDESGVPTVTDEVSCRAIVPHRVRSGSRIITEEGGLVRAPTLRAFGRLTYEGRGQPVSRLTVEGKKRPILLGVNFESPAGGVGVPAQVHVGTTLYQRDDATDALVVDPNVAERTAPTLPFIEPRAYPPSESLSVTYEGQLSASRPTGEFELTSAGRARFTDSSAEFCDLGVQGSELTMIVGEKQFGLTSGSLTRFASRHTDYVQLASLLYDESDSYWDKAGATCGGSDSSVSGAGFALCDSVFGSGEEDELSEARDLTVYASYQDYLEVGPRGLSGSSAQERMELMKCCFPGALEYRLRAGHQWVVAGDSTGYQHSVQADPESDDGKCAFSSSALDDFRKGRAFEISAVRCESVDPEDPESCGVGLRTNEDVVCAYDPASGPVEVDGTAGECIFDGLTRRFALYRGLEPSLRGMTFNYNVIGGFQGLSVSLGQSGIALPVLMSPLPQFGAMAVVDSQNQGLVMIDLANNHVGQRFF